MRRGLVFVTISMVLAGIRAAGAAEPASDVQLSTVPNSVYKIRDSGRGGTESWYFNLVVADAQGREGIRPLRAELEVFAGATLRETISLPEATLELMQETSYRVTPETDPLSLRRRFSLDEVFDLRLGFVAKPVTWEADRVRITLTLDVPGPKNAIKTLDVRIGTRSQKTKLVFPMQGPGIVTQGQVNNFGHSGHSNQFAIDVMGLDAEYGPMVNGGQGNAGFAGWGRDVIAPANGRVVYARNDVPDNPPDGGDPQAVYSKVSEPLLAIAGNCVIIDHGNEEFSVLMHLQQGSVTVEVGKMVRQGQVIARLGNSGDAFGAHLHYQLQDGPALFRANSLPVQFDNLAGVDLARGVYVEPR